MQPVSPFGLIPPAPFPIPPVPGPAAPQETSFQESLSQALGQMQSLNGEAHANIQQSLVGEELTMAETFTSIREADLAFRLMLQIRNKLLDAYQEIQQLRM